MKNKIILTLMFSTMTAISHAGQYSLQISSGSVPGKIEILTIRTETQKLESVLETYLAYKDQCLGLLYEYELAGDTDSATEERLNLIDIQSVLDKLEEIKILQSAPK